MQVLQDAYSNFVNSINSDQTRQIYDYTLTQFLKHGQMDLNSFLRLDQYEISNIIINYLLEKKISRQYKVVIFSAIKHACEMNDIILNWKKLKKFIKSDRTDNSINGNLDKKAVGNRTFDLLDSTRLALKPFEKSEHR